MGKEKGNLADKLDDYFCTFTFAVDFRIRLFATGELHVFPFSLICSRHYLHFVPYLLFSHNIANAECYFFVCAQFTCFRMSTSLLVQVDWLHPVSRLDVTRSIKAKTYTTLSPYFSGHLSSLSWNSLWSVNGDFFLLPFPCDRRSKLQIWVDNYFYP